MPEAGDTDFSWHEFTRRNNDELVATYGNLAHRVLTFVYRNFDGCVPVINEDELNILSKDMIEDAKMTLENVGDFIFRCQFKRAIMRAMHLAQETNGYLESELPWKVIKEDKQAAGRTLYTAICILSCLRTALYPFLPFSSQKLHELLGFEGNVADDGWQLRLPPPGQKLLPPEPLFAKLDEAIIEEEASRLG